MRANQIILLLLLAVYIVGCDPRGGTSTSAPSTSPAAPSPLDESDSDADQAAELVKPSTSQPAIPAAVEIAGAEYDFPPVQLRLKSQEGRIIALLTSDDPPAAAEPDYTGNSIYMEFPLDIPESRTLAGAHWEGKATHSEREDEINGLYLKGQQIAIQPADVRVDVLGDVSPVKIGMTGTFLWFDDETATGRPVLLKAELTAVVKTDSRD